jgi:opacity protein-like surface antigen
MGVKFWWGTGLAASIAVGTGVAGAADLDMPVKAPVYKALPAVVSDWSGFYVGVHGGYGWGHSSIDTPGFPYLVSTKPQDTRYVGNFDADPKGGVVGGQAGYNWQYGRIVTGLEIDFSAADISASGTVGTFSLECLPAPGTISRFLKFDELATARARLGYLVLPDLLAYGTGGLAWGHSELGGAASVGQPSWLPAPGSSFADNFGWVTGGGLEQKLWEHWLVRVEYLHYDFGKATYVTPAFTTSAATTIDVARAGLSYKF